MQEVILKGYEFETRKEIHDYLKEKLKPLCDSELLKNSLEEIGLSVFEQKIDKLCDFIFQAVFIKNFFEDRFVYHNLIHGITSFK